MLYSLLRCPFCREVFDIELETLPTPDTKEPPLCCDSCKRKGVDNQLAVVYCTTCSTKLCAKHREFHDEVVEGHPIIAISEYRTNAGKFRPRLYVLTIQSWSTL
ncbi:hypothetical protein EB796_005943 [Bugula neritina]|uniref:Uncharacterized protein n=1 Tax=Bugula neritina TaxID=10212 RepID=A0A7J7KD17_BUGNE|nr:hypothetical protein EB796_005943 [Bugula neritina]